MKNCKYCLLDEDQNDMISPCSCKGTNGYVHRNCLETWIKSDINIHKEKCRECNYVFQYENSVYTCMYSFFSRTKTIIVFFHFILAIFVYFNNISKCMKGKDSVITITEECHYLSYAFSFFTCYFIFVLHEIVVYFFNSEINYIEIHYEKSQTVIYARVLVCLFISFCVPLVGFYLFSDFLIGFIFLRSLHKLSRTKIKEKNHCASVVII